jgi:hypothetical protein
VLGQSEAAAGTVRVTDVTAGLEFEVGQAPLIRLAGDAYAARRPRVDWPAEITAV